MKKIILKNISRENRFKQIFVDLVYDNMAMENEAVFSKKEIARRYKLLIDGLIRDGIHKKVAIIDYGKN